MSKFLFGFGFGLMLVALCIPTHAAVIYVPDDYAEIQWAVDNASIGDIIIVRDGVYVENVDVHKQLTIKSENGSANCIIEAANQYDTIFEVAADYVNISSFTIKGSTWAGIYIHANYCNVSNNIISDSYRGIFLSHSNNNEVVSNKISSNDYGIYLLLSNNNGVLRNTILNSDYDGIYLYSSDNNDVIDNTVSNNGDGISLSSSDNNEIVNNKISSNGYGIYLSHSNNNEILSNTILDNEDGVYLLYSRSNSIENNIVKSNNYGIYLSCSIYNDITGNTVNSNNLNGVHLSHSNNNDIVSNTVASNNENGIYVTQSDNNNISSNKVLDNYFGIYLWYSNNNVIYLNNLNNVNNVEFYNSLNIWNSTEKITYTHKGKSYTSYLGNYWSDYIKADLNDDGICDTPYVIDENNIDYYPLVELVNITANISVESFSLNATSGVVPLTVEINATVVNTGEISGSTTVYFYVEGEEIYNETVEVGAGELVYVIHTYTFKNAGTYNVSVNDLTYIEVVVTPTLLDGVDSNNNGIIELDEVDNLITKFKADGSVDDLELLEAIQYWLDGKMEDFALLKVIQEWL